MEQQNSVQELLNQLNQPGFCVSNNTIMALNQAAAAMLLNVGDSICAMLEDNAEDYAGFNGGALYLPLRIGGQSHTATVTRLDGWDLFLLEAEEDAEQFHTLSLVSMELRKPLIHVITSAQQLMAEQDASDPATASMNRGLMQLMRMVCNMSDVSRYQSFSQKETREICGFLQELLEKAKTLTDNTGIRVTGEFPGEAIYTQIDPEQLERAVWNLISNAIKFTPKGGSVHVRLTRRGRRLFLSVTDSGSGIAENILSTLFRRYQRMPAIEDGRFGLGLGMVLIRITAANHGGTVLVDQPEGSGTRITMTLTIPRNNDSVIHSPILLPDYSSGWDHGLMELSDCLGADLYQNLL